MQKLNVLITGGTDGIGKAIARRFATTGANLILVGRNRTKGETAAGEIIRSSGHPAVDYLQADLSLLSEVRRTAERIRRSWDRMDILVHCAGGAFPLRRTVTAEGLEWVFAVQYFARFLLTRELLDSLGAAPAPKVASIAGGGGFHQVDFPNIQGERKYDMFGAINRAGTLNNLLTLDQTTRYPDITFYNYGPGMVRTAVMKSNWLMALVFNTAGRLISRTAEEASNDVVRLLMEEWPGGFYGPSLQRKKASASADDALKLKIYSDRLLESISG
jgi:NAD(P)-dependent dehydrogenase (short-subunit alcohol dehydrogenase family)